MDLKLLFLIALAFFWILYLTLRKNIANENFFPQKDNKFTLGTESNRWKSLHVGEGTIFITDSSLGTEVALTIDNGVFFLDGIAQAQLPDLKVSNILFDDDNIQSHSSDFLFVDSPEGALSGGDPVTIDLSKQVLLMKDGEYWYLPDGSEGQIIYFVLSENQTVFDHYIIVDNIRIINNINSSIQSRKLTGQQTYRPFVYSNGVLTSTICTAIFTNGAWSFSNGNVAT
jgi:hypothetical protein